MQESLNSQTAAENHAEFEQMRRERVAEHERLERDARDARDFHWRDEEGREHRGGDLSGQERIMMTPIAGGVGSLDLQTSVGKKSAVFKVQRM